jgi:hypothetical protein
MIPRKYGCEYSKRNYTQQSSDCLHLPTELKNIAKNSFRISYVNGPKSKPKLWNSEHLHKPCLLESETLILRRQILFLRHLNLIYLLYYIQAQFVLIFLSKKKNNFDVTILCACACGCVCVCARARAWALVCVFEIMNGFSQNLVPTYMIKSHPNVIHFLVSYTQ